jgi:hypothetical protein
MPVSWSSAREPKCLVRQGCIAANLALLKLIKPDPGPNSCPILTGRSCRRALPIGRRTMPMTRDRVRRLLIVQRTASKLRVGGGRSAQRGHGRRGRRRLCRRGCSSPRSLGGGRDVKHRQPLGPLGHRGQGWSTTQTMHATTPTPIMIRALTAEGSMCGPRPSWLRGPALPAGHSPCRPTNPMREGRVRDIYIYIADWCPSHGTFHADIEVTGRSISRPALRDRAGNRDVNVKGRLIHTSRTCMAEWGK